MSFYQSLSIQSQSRLVICYILQSYRIANSKIGNYIPLHYSFSQLRNQSRPVCIHNFDS